MDTHEESAQSIDAFFTLGMTPQVVTETLFALQGRNERVRNLTVLATSSPESLAQLRQLFDDDWTPGTRLKELFARYPRTRISGQTLVVFCDSDDVRKTSSVQEIGQRIHDEVKAAIERAEDLPLVACLSGGRKTMSAWLTLAMTLRARPVDRLVHVLVQKELEHPKLWPPSSPEEESSIALTELPFPRLGMFVNRIREDHIDQVIRELTSDLTSVADSELVIHLRAQQSPRGLEVRWGGQELPLSPQAASQLAMFVEYGGTIRWRSLTEEQRRRFAAFFEVARLSARGGPGNNIDGEDPLPREDTDVRIFHGNMTADLKKKASILYAALDFKSLGDKSSPGYVARGLASGRVRARVVPD
jgi:CRISPR-associated protein (TIGR02584 family)